MSFNRTSTNEEIAATPVDLKTDDITYWERLFDLPPEFHNEALQKLQEAINSNKQNKTLDEYYNRLEKVLADPQKLSEKIAGIPPQARFMLMLHTSRNFLFSTTLLAEASMNHYPPESLRILLECVPRGFLPYAEIATRLLYSTPKKLDLYLSMLNETGRSILLRVRSHEQNDSLLHAAADYPDAFKKLLALENDHAKKQAAILAKNKQGIRVLDRTAHNNESFDAAFSLLSDHPQLYSIVTDSNHSLLHHAFTQPNMLRVLAAYPPNEIKSALTDKSFDGPPIRRACSNLYWLESVLALLAKEDQQQVMKAAGSYAQQLIEHLAMFDDSGLLKVLGFYSEDDRLHVIPFEKLLNYPPEKIIAVMNMLSASDRERPEDRIQLVNDRVAFLEGDRRWYKSFLLTFANQNLVACLKVLDALPTFEDQLKAIELAGGKGEFMNLLKYCRPAAFEKYNAALTAFNKTLDATDEKGQLKIPSPAFAARQPDAAETFHENLKKARESKSIGCFGLFDPTAKFYLIPDFIPSNLSVVEYKQLQGLHEELQTISRNLSISTEREYWDYHACQQNSEVLDKLEKLRGILSCFERDMKNTHGIEPVRPDPCTVLIRAF